MQIHEVRDIYPDEKKYKYRGINQFINNIYQLIILNSEFNFSAGFLQDIRVVHATSFRKDDRLAYKAQ
jgi:hypothetical protein